MASWFGGFSDMIWGEEAGKEAPGFDGETQDNYEPKRYPEYDRYDPLLQAERTDFKISQKTLDDFLYENEKFKTESFYEQLDAFWENENTKKMVISKLKTSNRYNLFLNRKDGPKSRSLLENVSLREGKKGTTIGLKARIKGNGRKSS